MSLILDSGDKNKDFRLRILVMVKNSATSPKLYKKNCIFGPNLEKMKKMVTKQENKLVLSLYQYIKLMYKILGQSKVKRRSYGEISIKTAISGPKS